MNRKLAVLMSLVVAACSPESGTDAGSGSDSGTPASRLTINAATGLRQVEFQTKDEPPLATLLVKFDGNSTECPAATSRAARETAGSRIALRRCWLEDTNRFPGQLRRLQHSEGFPVARWHRAAHTPQLPRENECSERSV